MGLAEFVLARLAEEEAEWSSRVDAGGPSGQSARRFLEACRAEIRNVTIRRANPRGEPGLDGDLKALALPYYDHPDFQAQWYLAPARDRRGAGASRSRGAAQRLGAH